MKLSILLKESGYDKVEQNAIGIFKLNWNKKELIPPVHHQLSKSNCRK